MKRTTTNTIRRHSLTHRPLQSSPGTMPDPGRKGRQLKEKPPCTFLTLWRIQFQITLQFLSDEEGLLRVPPTLHCFTRSSHLTSFNMSSRVYTATAAVQITPILSLVPNLHESDGHDIQQIEYILYLGHFEHLDRCVSNPMVHLD